MSRYTYVGKFVNPVEGMGYELGDDDKYYITVEDSSPCPHCGKPEVTTRRHSMHGEKGDRQGFDEAEDAIDWLEGTREAFEDDYDNYLEEHHDDIVAQERWENFRNEY
jgi:hypothetical protein